MTWVTHLLLALLPATHCARFLESVRIWLAEILANLIDLETQTFFDFAPSDLATLNAHLTNAEELLRLAIGVRVCELNSWSKHTLRRHGGGCLDPNPTPERLLARLERCAFLLRHFEQHAARRAHQLAAASWLSVVGRALSTASPAQAGVQTRSLKAIELCSSSALRALTGSPPSWGTRPRDFIRARMPAGGRLIVQFG